MLIIIFKTQIFVLAWVTDDPMSLGYFIDYAKKS